MTDDDLKHLSMTEEIQQTTQTYRFLTLYPAGMIRFVVSMVKNFVMFHPSVRLQKRSLILVYCLILSSNSLGTILTAEQVMYTMDGTWLRLSTDCIISLHVHEATTPDYKPPLHLKWVCAERRNEDPLCIPSNCLLYESLWVKSMLLGLMSMDRYGSS